MSNQQHTPGPWKVSDSCPQSVTTAVGEFYWLSWGHLPYQHEEYGINPEADARLIAESPCLLLFAEWCVSQLQGESGAGDNYWEQFPEYEQGLASIARATGKEGA